MSFAESWEQKAYYNIREKRDLAVSPVVWLFKKIHIGPNAVTLSGVVFALVFSILIYYHLYLEALISWVLVILTDLIDGALARKLAVDDDHGRFIDMVADNIVFTIFALTMAAMGRVDPVTVGLFVYFMLASKVLRAIVHAGQIESDWRFYAVAGFLPNFIVAIFYIFYLVFIIFGDWLFGLLMLISIPILILDSLCYFIKIVNRK